LSYRPGKRDLIFSVLSYTPDRFKKNYRVTDSVNDTFLPAGVTGTIQVGPGPLRVETRLLDHPGDQVEYVLETTLGDLPASYHKLTPRLSGKARHEEWVISHKERLSLEAPAEKRTLKVRILAPSRADCLIRVRQPESTTDD
jgi:hypothetical protein